MNNQRIIRPAINSRTACAGAVELNLEDLKALSQQMIEEAREKLQKLHREKIALREKICQQKKAAEAEYEHELEKSRLRLQEQLEQERKETLDRGHNEGLEEGRREGFEKGYSDGREAGYKEGRETEIQRIQDDTQSHRTSIQSLVDEITKNKNELFQGARTELIQLAMEVARRVVKREVRDFNNEILVENLKQAIELIFLQSKIHIQLHPDDIPIIEKYTEEVLGQIQVNENFEVQPVMELKPGDCRVVSGTGLVDFSLATQLKVIEEVLLGKEMAGQDMYHESQIVKEISS